MTFFGNVRYGSGENGPFQCQTQAQKMLFWHEIRGFHAKSKGHIFDEIAVHLSEKRVQGIQNIPILTSVSALTLVNYLRDFIPSLTSHLQP